MENQDSNLLVDILKKGIKIRNGTLVGYTKNQLERIGLDKKTLNKGIKLGLIKKTYVSNEQCPYSQCFYCVEVDKEDKSEVPNITAPGITINTESPNSVASEE